MVTRPRLFAWEVAMFLIATPLSAQDLVVSDSQTLSAGKHLWQNECDGKVAGLTSWNAGENFASLGIGHYIWYPDGQRGAFEESFPELLRYLAHEQVALPPWLSTASACPWNSRAEFERDQSGTKLTELRAILAKTVALQARFSANRLQAALPKMLGAASAEQRPNIKNAFSLVARSPNGVYALVDYVNFKGEGSLESERYQGQGWGLLQVLAGMQLSPSALPGPQVTQEFAASAARALTKRVALSPSARGESRWLPGWKKRVQSYASER